MTDDIRTLSEALARDPASAAFLRLGELLRQRGEMDLASRVAFRGLERHPRRVDAHELVARIAIDRGDVERARVAWEAVLMLAPGHPGAQKGLGFLCYRQGDVDAAQRHLEAAWKADASDQSVSAALRNLRSAASPAGTAGQGRATRVITPPVGALQSPVPPFAPRAADAKTVFAPVLGGPGESALLLDADGYVLAGQHVNAAGEEVGASIGAQLSGVGQEADRAMRHLGLGAWTQLVFEADLASIAMAPAGSGVILVAVPRTTPLGFLRRVLTRALERATQWLERGV